MQQWTPQSHGPDCCGQLAQRSALALSAGEHSTPERRVASSLVAFSLCRPIESRAVNSRLQRRASPCSGGPAPAAVVNQQGPMGSVPTAAALPAAGLRVVNETHHTFTLPEPQRPHQLARLRRGGEEAQQGHDAGGEHRHPLPCLRLQVGTPES
eukprot:TRINITY_DN2267_c0_g1_i3.p2 TRINITY_DN2267_c0_g1~~TRINITY_DN2267_c0_g1_i3.p2  ORF type:complete len:154 (-),score=15.01 TRINITY_DN2267_c0_g1_i3:219-680(-)